LLQEVLIRHPTLRLYLENAGYPFLDEMISLMYRYLSALIDAGLGNRLMWGSDQMNWPGTIDLSLDAIREAPFLSEQQKRDILYNNAARFLRLDAPPVEEGN
jgi:predicted TIM-barrel fold metal-dependent hydrolase